MIISASVWWLGVVPAGASVAVLYSLAFPSGNSGPFLLGGAVWAVVGVVWLIWFCWGRSRLLALTPLLALLTAVLAWTDVPLRAAFAVAEGRLDQQRASGEAGRAGIYEIAKVAPVEGTDVTRFTIAGTGGPYYDETGFLHAPSGMPAPSPELAAVAYRRITGPWYWYDVPTR
ncbi:hypothetical protein LO762_21980 [Actinocorallia sp. API 0066]|uniref:hypothetical protein n=1 Tax=Actinocorallia sp. API 0066 TaxID=2896846 RepID=UPI001E4E8F9D|nr:hypothetical protein [Actinocorallia sp. API 0066]MCD0451844.1 hypothetical protein [Actinocorallia sp. API 0066]